MNRPVEEGQLLPEYEEFLSKSENGDNKIKTSINILGTEYRIEEHKVSEDEYLKENRLSGYCGEESKLDELEKEYIQKYNSAKNGYNEALGGKGKPLWTDKQLEACKTLYDNGWLLKDIALLFNSSYKTVGKKLRSKYNIETKENSYKSFGKKIQGVCADGQEICFDSLSDAGRYLIEENYTKNKNLYSVLAKIENSLKNNACTAYGFKWNYL